MLQFYMRSDFIPQIEDAKLKSYLFDRRMEGDDTIKHPPIKYRYFPVRSMFMVVVGHPRRDKNFVGVCIFRKNKQDTYR